MPRHSRCHIPPPPLLPPPARLPQLPMPKMSVTSPPMAGAHALFLWRLQINLQAGAQNLTIGNRVLTVGQFHWHASSEHTVDNFHHAMELHFVLTYVDTGAPDRSLWLPLGPHTYSGSLWGR